ncbi:hypothetical protein [Sphingobium yanoikuyae]|jgi:hypothetical protein|uniref:Uncharacterized protein n=1 Tax=Sphingobium yanoikuyae TaxID=13690 RepID=A0A9X7YAK7_SPHYA|nr:hypothetical protein [Sphingobium yanoikuyae]QNG43540.1 hypothetical protein H3V42_16350 [Sphingobium yanoikuyae]
MNDIRSLPVMTGSDAQAIGFAAFNAVPTLPIDIPDGGFTLSAKTSEGRRITFYFGPYVTGGPARFVDIQYHDLATVPDARGAPAPVFDMFTIGHGDARAYDSRREEVIAKPSIAVILLSGPSDDDC